MTIVIEISRPIQWKPWAMRWTSHKALTLCWLVFIVSFHDKKLNQILGARIGEFEIKPVRASGDSQDMTHSDYMDMVLGEDWMEW